VARLKQLIDRIWSHLKLQLRANLIFKNPTQPHGTPKAAAKLELFVQQSSLSGWLANHHYPT
jgi:hypothetical protein